MLKEDSLILFFKVFSIKQIKHICGIAISVYHVYRHTKGIVKIMIQIFATIFESGGIGENIGVGRLKAYIEENGEAVEVIYLDKNRSIESQWDKVSKNCSIFGFSMYNTNLEYFIEIINKIKEQISKSIIVVGSKFVTAYYEEILRNYSNIDFAILGHGEKALLDLIKYSRSESIWNTDILSHDNIVSKHSLDGKQAAVLDIKELPWPNRSWIKNNDLTSAYICESHGCVGKCSFCTYSTSHGRWNGRSALDIYQELVEINNVCKISNFEITGGSFEDPGILGKQKIRDLCFLILENKKMFSFRYYLRADSFSDTKEDKELLQLMRKSGFNVAQVGIESGNSEDLLLYNKRATLKQNKDTLNLLNEMDIFARFFGFIMFNPYTTKERLKLNYRFLCEFGAGLLSMFVNKLEIYNKTSICNQVKKDDLLTCEGRFYDNGFTYKYRQSDIEEIDCFINKYFNGDDISKINKNTAGSCMFIYNFYKFVDSGLFYRNKMLEILNDSANLLKEYFYVLYEEFDINKCENMFTKMIKAYAKNSDELFSLRNTLLKQYLRHYM